MASRNQVTLTFAGDSSQLETSFDRVGSSAREMGGDVERAADDIKVSAGESFDRVGEAADNVDTRAMGFRDTVTGLQDTMRGLSDESLGLGERLLTLGMGVGDLASGMFNFIIPAVKSLTLSTLSNIKATVTSTASNAAHKVGLVASTAATKAATVAQRALNLVLRANPIGLVITLIAALAAGLVLAWKKSETFRNIVKGAMQVARDAIGFVIEKGQALLEFFQNLPGKISRAASGMWDGIKNAFRSAINFIIDGWNNLSLTLPGVDTPFGTIGGFTLSTPNIPRLHTGGVFHAPPGRSEGLALLRDEERVLPAGQRMRDEPITVNVMLSREAIAGIAKVEIREGNRLLKRQVVQGAGVAG